MLLAFACVAGAQQIQYAEPVNLSFAAPTAQFDAYGRRFSLALTENDRLLQKLPAQRKLAFSRYRVLRGAVEGQPGSWVRLVESAGGVEGAIWDGHDLYAVTRYAEAAPFLTTPLQAAPDQTVVYRLSDVQEALPRDFCALGGTGAGIAKQTALQQYQALVTDLQGTADGRANRQIEIAVVADSAFAAAEQPDPTAAMLARVNIVEGIYTEQVGLLVLATDISVASADADPFTSTQPTTLLEQVGSWRRATPAARARGLAHLMTGKNLDGTTAGIAYLGTACEVDRGVSLSERSYGTTISALIMAHELGHNFGAPHDGETGGACASTATGMIMSPSITGHAKFSQCSIDVIRATLDSARCVTAADYADVSLAASATNIAAEGGVPFSFAFTVRSAGTRQAENVQFDLGLSDTTGLTLESVAADGGSCTISGPGANCSFGPLAPGETRTVTVTALGVVANNLSAHARLSAGNDALGANDTRDVVIAIRSGVDAAIGISSSSRNVPLGASLEVVADLRSLRALPVRNAVLTLNLNQAVTSASMPGAACTVSAFSVICAVAELAPGATARLTVNTRTSAAGPLFATANVSAPGDGDSTNNSANTTAWVQAERDVEITAGPATVDLAVGGIYEIPFTVRSLGTQATGDVAVWISMRSGVAVLDSLNAGGATCSEDIDSWHCVLGAIAPGDSRVVRMRVRGLGVGSVDVQAMAEAADDGYNPNNSTGVRLRIDNAVDLGIALASGGVGIEDVPIDGQVSVRSGGRDTASNAILELAIPSGGTLLRAHVQEGADCQIVDPRHARCALPPLARGAYAYIDWRVLFDDPGSYEAKFTLSTPGDSATGNDSLTRTLLVRPYNDIGVTGALDLTQFIVGDTRELTFEVSSARRLLSQARFVASNARPGVEVSAIRADFGDCKVVADTGGVCDFTNLAPDSRVRVTVTWSALAPATAQEVEVSVSTPGDVSVANDELAGTADVVGHTDVELRVDTASDGISGQVMDFPPIAVVNGDEKAVGTRLEVNLPAGVALVSVSAANAICSGTTVLRCDFAELEANSTSTVNLSLRAGAGGNYVSALQLSSLNDVNPANDSREVALNISSTRKPTAEAKAGGGGGSLEWLSLALLGMLAALRLAARRRWNPSNPARMC
ncbi:MAG TPA: M12 family metallo-peptidase [Steroidobacteraceae bacterium]|nr:M12 family metallo-peptidase [Steroidobacteraceae bacterium]